MHSTAARKIERTLAASALMTAPLISSARRAAFESQWKSRFRAVWPAGFLHAGLEPGASVSPVAKGRGARDAQDFRRFVRGQAGEEAKLGDLGGLTILLGEAVERVHEQHPAVVGGRRG